MVEDDAGGGFGARGKGETVSPARLLEIVCLLARRIAVAYAANRGK